MSTIDNAENQIGNITPTTSGTYSVELAGTIRITDPSYMTPGFPGVVPLDDLSVTFQVERSIWNVYATLMDNVPASDARTGMLILSRANQPDDRRLEAIELGHASVDCGHLAVMADRPEGITDWESYGHQLVFQGPQPGQVIEIDGTLAIQSGLGDGNYQVTGHRDKNTGQLLEIEVDLTPSHAAWELLYGGVRSTGGAS